jgi:hypothetical protein
VEQCRESVVNAHAVYPVQHESLQRRPDLVRRERWPTWHDHRVGGIPGALVPSTIPLTLLRTTGRPRFESIRAHARSGTNWPISRSGQRPRVTVALRHRRRLGVGACAWESGAEWHRPLRPARPTTFVPYPIQSKGVDDGLVCDLDSPIQVRRYPWQCSRVASGSTGTSFDKATRRAGAPTVMAGVSTGTSRCSSIPMARRRGSTCCVLACISANRARTTTATRNRGARRKGRVAARPSHAATSFGWIRTGSLVDTLSFARAVLRDPPPLRDFGNEGPPHVPREGPPLYDARRDARSDQVIQRGLHPSECEKPFAALGRLGPLTWPIGCGKRSRRGGAGCRK